VLVLTPYPYGTAPGPRSSIELWERVLAPHGISFDYAPFGSAKLHSALYAPGRRLTKMSRMTHAYVSRFGDVRRAAEYDAVLVYREAALIGPEVFERLVARTGTPIIYQLDDPLYVPYRSPFNGYLSYLKFFGKVGRIAALSAVTIVNSDQHRDYVSSFTDRIVQIPSMVDGERFRYRVRPPREDGTVCIGWTGSPSTTANLNVIAGALRRIGARADVRLHFIGSGGFDLPGIPHTSQRWTDETEVDDLRALDVGLLPLPDDGWTRRKFYMKLVQYMTLGIPPVCTPLGSAKHVVVPGETGFLARTEDEWVAALERLLDPNVRLTMGRAAARRAHSFYTLQAQAENIVRAIRAAVAPP
jgi:glycosyltransferase involved in cell wall biosynthesis